MCLLVFGLHACNSNESNDNGGDQREVVCGNVTCETGCCTYGDANAECSADPVNECLTSKPGLRGYYMACDGPEDCASGELCCISVGAIALGSTNCGPPSACEGGYAQQIACHSGGDCPAPMTCGPAWFADTFVPTLLGCQ